MLDKTIPYIEFKMKREPGAVKTLTQPKLPSDYQLVFYSEGDQTAWCEIETAVGEFEALSEAEQYFEKTFAPFPHELQQRMAFIIDPTGKKVGTCTAWWSKENEPLLHWLAVVPEAQRKGLAGFLATIITERLEDLYPNQPIILHTQTWSHSAIRLYEKLGYQLVPGTKDFKKGLTVLQQVQENNGDN
ncbi:GNAT family N-acetyltransferase [Enterococcus sp. AD013-P3]|uniref:GNAT family N-acetyltransferase n=1 Tax=Enterococcus sp. AD013-P3 TaxID=3411036 RepID=UPI003B94E6B9